MAGTRCARRGALSGSGRASYGNLHERNARAHALGLVEGRQGNRAWQQVAAHGYYIRDTEWIDFFDPEADRLLPPRSMTSGSASSAIDAWWQDATEPENDDLTGTT